jgi:4-aminobutyrate aminotransferase/(S)-3-amino-2-methylpropionate transaminase
LRKIAKEYQIPFIVDETRTGVGSTGKMWAHEHWNLSDPADIVSFGGKAGISGFYSTLDYQVHVGDTTFNND